MTDLICVGRLGGAYGVRGELRLKSFCAVPEDIETYNPLTTDDGTPVTVALIGAMKGGFSARIVGVDTKEQADALKGVSLFARRDQFPDPEDDEYYYADLEGLAVHDTGGALVGRVKTVQNHGADDLLEVTLQGSSDTALIPFTKASVPTVDLRAGRIVIDPPDGILP